MVELTVCPLVTRPLLSVTPACGANGKRCAKASWRDLGRCLWEPDGAKVVDNRAGPVIAVGGWA